MKHSFKTLLSLALGSIIMMACSNDGNKKTQKAASEIDDVSISQIIEDFENIPTPTSIDLMKMVNSLGVSYVFDATNSLANQENYLSTKQKALNLGVYSADLSYEVAYQRKAETEEYLKCILEMASDLNISIDANKISDKFQNNINNVEELTTVVKDLFKDSQYILAAGLKAPTSASQLLIWHRTIWISSRWLSAISNIRPLSSNILRAGKTMPILLSSTRL